MNSILFVNHRTPECGVEQMGSRYYRNLMETRKYETYYIDVDKYEEFEHWYNVIRPAAVIWNFYSLATMGWFSTSVLTDRAEAKHVAIYHELPLENVGFDLILHQDPNSPDKFAHWSLPRSIPEWNGFTIVQTIPTFGSFGFGIGGKGFARLVRMVNEEYDVANIHLHIPFAAFGDADGKGARAHAEDARRANVKPDIQLTIDHDFWKEADLLEWLAGNDCNAFLYDPHHGRGISGTLDYALAVRRPIAITKSEQFRHVWTIEDRICVENNSLHDIIALGSKPTDKFRQMWSREAFVASFEQALESLGV